MTATTMPKGPTAHPQVRVRTGSDLALPELEQLRQAGLDKIAPVEAWSIDASTQRLAYATHGVFRYFGKFPPPVASHLIGRYTDPGDLVVDPTGGSGTTGVESQIANRKARLYDVNPLALLLARVKTTPVSMPDLQTSKEGVLAAYASTSDGEARYRPIGLRNPDHWFLPETTASLARLRRAIEGQPEGPARDCLWIAFAATVRPVSRATTQQGRLFLDVDTAQADAWPTFERRFDRLAKAVSQLPANDTVIVENRSLLSEIPDEDAGIADLLIVHPPYFNAYKYSGVNSLELSWLGVDHKDTRREEIREFFKVGKAENATRYVQDMTQGLVCAARYLKPQKRMAVMIGDTVIKGEFIPVTRSLIDELKGADASLELESVALRVPKYTEASWAASQRRDASSVGITLADYVLTFRKAS